MSFTMGILTLIDQNTNHTMNSTISISSPCIVDVVRGFGLEMALGVSGSSESDCSGVFTVSPSSETCSSVKALLIIPVQLDLLQRRVTRWGNCLYSPISKLTVQDLCALNGIYRQIQYDKSVYYDNRFTIKDVLIIDCLLF